MTKKWLVSMLGAAAMTASAGAMAQQSMATPPNFYAGLDVGQSDVGSENDTGFRIFGGYQFHKHIAAEIGYGLLFDKSSVEVTTIEAVAVGIFPLTPNFSILGKLGFANVNIDCAAAICDDKTELTYGIGVQWDFTRNLGVRGQWQRYDIDPQEVDFVSIGVVWRF